MTGDGLDVEMIRQSLNTVNQKAQEPLEPHTDGATDTAQRNPLHPLVWLAHMLAERGKALKAGMPVITGSIIPPKPLSAGETATMAIGGLDETHVTVF